ncbi:MAG: hypothetical protein COA78_02490 [Blastopirellula sp.]|nr:MAG: hypothetical protein COA78_02490 [Blastopirellula sp.]
MQLFQNQFERTSDSHTGLRCALKLLALLIACFCCLTLFSQRLQAEDLVSLNPTGPKSPTQLRGTVLEYTGEVLILRTIGGREDQIAGSKVTGIQYTKISSHQLADKAFANKKYQNATIAYGQAMQLEDRRWVKREILAQLSWCHRYQGQIDLAGEDFLLIVRSDPTTRLLGEMPLAWMNHVVSIELERRAVSWIQNRELPYAQLMGASWLLFTVDRKTCISVLKSLELNPNPIIAQLAEMQLRRTKLHLAIPAQIDMWEAQITRLPKTVRAGPTYLISKARDRQKEPEVPEVTALSYMKIPILYPRHHHLVSDALFQTARQLEELERPEEAARIYREVITNYQHTASSNEAKLALEQLLEASD